ncbi:hypothetical protein M422DRAFT_272671 [Sphaerobolus stellatus SS14]|uniref:FAD-binding domain-containing protein n=1 Tax=Sphaerobolus stellatus (strain SS14) TaxID=990650 RepID=A0A0C9UB17_SPHS4|nr:hypothetical protein M422DRAFT_272671 [Sphaerobolus stellatus SS14]
MANTLPSEVEALVVGAGPVGLTATITLKQLGINVAIVDKDITNKNGSRAAVVHSGTLEILETIGMVKPIVTTGFPMTNINFYGKTNKLLGINLGLLEKHTAYPFSVLISQEQVENLLRQKLKKVGLNVIPRKIVTGYSYDDTSKAINVTFEDGSSIRTQYLIGSDGARSVVRNQSHIRFADPYSGLSYDDVSTPAQTFHMALADVFLKDPLPPKLSKKSLSVHLDKFFTSIPLPSTDPKRPGLMWRIIFGYPTEGGVPHAPGIDFFQEQMDKRNPWGERIVIEKVITSSRYRVRAALVDKYWTKVGNGDILLAGDAAHVHSPLGGQGMNLGICDAIALGKAIHSHFGSKKAGIPSTQADEILQKYSDDRRNIGYKVIGLTKKLTTILSAGTGWRKLLRNTGMKVLGWLPFVRWGVAWRVSGLGNRA